MTAREGPRVLAIVLNWQQAQVTLSCVERLRALKEPALDILVLDNGSGDDSARVLRERADAGAESVDGPEFELIELSQNLGFARGNNHGLRLALERGYDFALVINNDAFVEPGMLRELLAQTADDVALLSPKILYESQPDRIWFAGGDRQAQTLDLINTGRGEADSAGRFPTRDVDYVLGACMLVNLAAARVVGLFDERYFFYFEDLDWSIRFVEEGYRLRYVAEARVQHRVATSTGGELDTPQRRFYLAYGGVLFWRQHARTGSPAVILAFRALSALKMVMRLLISGRAEAAAAYFRGLRAGWRASKRGRPTASLT